jgi:octaprenyl-diphosphate synthase
MLETTSSALSAIRAPIQTRLEQVVTELTGLIPADFDAIEEVNEYLFSGHGKLFRPTLLLLANELGGRASADGVKLGAIVELLHVATLVHDDSVDHSVERRGMPTVNARWTHQVAVIMGDYLYSRAVIEITALGNLEAIAMLADTANRMTIGEMRQLVSHDALGFSQEDYRLLCECKTASLMSTACELGALSGDPRFRAAMNAYGYHLGMAFQIADDLLDYTSSASVTGKPSGLDLREHKVTLPLITALPRMEATERALVEELFADPEPTGDLVEAVIEAVEAFEGLTVARDEAERMAGRASEQLDGLPEGEVREALRVAVDYVVNRKR